MSDYKERLRKFVSFKDRLIDRPLARIYANSEFQTYGDAAARFKNDIQTALDRIKELENR